MPAAAITITKRGDEAGIPLGGNKKIHFFDITADTGTYTTAGFSLTAAQLKVASIDFADAGSIATTGTGGVTANPIGITYAAGGGSITVQPYEGSAAGTALPEKTSNEAYETNFTFRLMVIGQ